MKIGHQLFSFTQLIIGHQSEQSSIQSESESLEQILFKTLIRTDAVAIVQLLSTTVNNTS
jgi:hypothetical protein